MGADTGRRHGLDISCQCLWGLWDVEDVYTEGRTAFLTGGPTSVGWWGRDNNNAETWVLRYWQEE
ncbi:MAG: hypothetical protein U5Q03_14925 [Bacteroidota bacterium]|nr:hypothetical protein [Bacteroidota bacterium]